MAKPTNLELLTALAAKSPQWKDIVETTSQLNWDMARIMWQSDDYASARNEIFPDLFTIIGLQRFTQRTLNNRLSIFKRGESLNGDLQEILVGDARSSKYDHNRPMFQTEYPKVHATMHKRNRMATIDTRTHVSMVKNSFNIEMGLSELIDRTVLGLYNTNEKEEYSYTRRLMSDMYNANNDALPLAPAQKITLPNRVTDDTTTPDQLDHYVETVQNLVGDLSFMKNGYTPYEDITTQVAPQDLVIIELLKVRNKANVRVLAKVFTEKYLALGATIEPIDEFDSDMSNTVCVVAHKEVFGIWDTHRAAHSAFVPSGEYTEHYLHIHQTYAAFPQYPIVFIDQPPINEDDN